MHTVGPEHRILPSVAQPNLCLWAAALLAVVLVPSAAFATTQAGVAAAISGQVMVTPEDQSAGRPAVSGMPINVLDTIRSGDASQMQVLLLDETVLTVGPNTEIQVDELVFDPNSLDKSKLTAKISKGAFGYVSGTIAANRPENVEIKVPVGTIGVRGTSIFGVEDPATGKTFIGLLGPGPRNDANLHPGGFTFTNDTGTTEVLRTGFGLFATPDQKPQVIAIPQNLLSIVLSNLHNQVANAGTGGTKGGNSGQGGNSGGQGGNACNLSGHSTATQQDNATVLNIINVTKGNTDPGGKPAQDKVLHDDRTSTPAPQSVVADTQSILANITRQVGANAIPVGLAVPLAIQLNWTSAGFTDFELHLTGPNLDGTRFHLDAEAVDQGRAPGIGNFGSAPFARIENDDENANGHQVAVINGFNSSGKYTVSAFADTGAQNDFNNPSNHVSVNLIKNGVMRRGAGGIASINPGSGTTIITVIAPQNQPGNVWTALDINPKSATAASVTVVNTVTHVNDPSQIR